MKEWKLIDSTEVPGTGSFMRLMSRGDELVIRVDGRELMSTRMHGSEDALANLAIDAFETRQKGVSNMRILIGGLGMGYTLAAALRLVGPTARVTVAELVPAVVEWNRGILGGSAGRPLEDSRTEVHQGDVAQLIRNSQAKFDAILLDVDNGPAGLTTKSNDWLYSFEGLTATRQALTQHGILAVWSASTSNPFTRLLRKVGFLAEAVPVRARGKKGGMRHWIWICKK